MNIIEIFLIGLALSMDAFAVAICLGLRHKATAKNMLTVGAYFGIFHVVMLLIGFYAATVFADSITAYDHWIAFGLLSFLGIKMMIGSFKEDKEDTAASLNYKVMLPLAVAMSIDALAIGISFAFIGVDIIPASLMISVVVFLLAMLGIRIGNSFGPKLGSKAEFLGGVVLVLIGTKILLQGLGIISLW
jgi:putative Mn2+ efflux pump MntP